MGIQDVSAEEIAEALAKLTDPELLATMPADDGKPYEMKQRRQGALAESALFPPGHLTLIVGHPGTGKSLLGLHLAARMSVHAALPPWGCVADAVAAGDDIQDYDNRQLPGGSLIFSREDDEFTIKSRLAVALGGNKERPGADMRFIDLREGSLVLPPREVREEEYGAVRRQRSGLHNALTGRSPGGHCTSLAIMDPLPAFLEHVDGTNNPGLIRAALEPILEYAARYRIALVGIMHMTKGMAGGALQRAARSHAYTALARSVVLVMQDEREADRRLVVPLKNNLAAVAGGYAFRIRQAEVGEAVAGMSDPHGFWKAATGPVPYVEWEEGFAAGVSGVAMTEAERVEKLRVEEAKDFLRVVLGGGPVWSAQVRKEARSVGIKERTLEEAKRRLGGWSEREAGRRGRWWMQLPAEWEGGGI